MSDDHPIEPRSIAFTQMLTLLVDEWPAWTALSETWLAHEAHVHHATVDGDTVTFHVGNGEATYQLRRDLDPVAGGILAELVDATTPAQARQLRRKWDDVSAKRMSRGRVVGR